MYESHWNLVAPPFDHRIEPRCYYPSESHQAALLKLLYAIETKRSVALLCGDSGMGKSMLIDSCIEQLPDSIGPVVRVPYPAMPAEQLVRYLARQVAPETQPEPQSMFSHSIEILENFLRHNLQQGRHALVIVDEAHLLEAYGSLHPLRMLLNLAADSSRSESAWTLCLVGTVPLIGHVARHGDLEDRVAVRCVLDRFSMDETVAYIVHRLRASGHNGDPVFTDRALEAIQEASLGIPRRINRLCDMSLMIGYAQELKQIDAPVVHIAQHELSSRSMAA
ncbi:MAG: AAA family ATPase [Pirellula sp.]|jgi:general secretion pathway protein A|nr:AAA family ATPase [Pirellula sp.]